MTVSAPEQRPDFILPPTAPSRISGSFDKDVESQFLFFNTMNSKMNEFSSYAYSTALLSYGNFIDAESSKSSSLNSANSSNQSAATASNISGFASFTANNQGNWSNLSGPASPPFATVYNGNFWVLNDSVSEVSSSPPSWPTWGLLGGGKGNLSWTFAVNVSLTVFSFTKQPSQADLMIVENVYVWGYNDKQIKIYPETYKHGDIIRFHMMGIVYTGLGSTSINIFSRSGNPAQDKLWPIYLGSTIEESGPNTGQMKQATGNELAINPETKATVCIYIDRVNERLIAHVQG